ncbi:hypothetical protein RRG08_061846 [Elysia crispata]|uniref:Uncharacterized protein n=1 Tax=Elysia crispata TaxID=231223 RepID=A0AAE1D1H3_9GAST|nr:hypothetical protein RRG08_061846 [Elysia crispata]
MQLFLPVLHLHCKDWTITLNAIQFIFTHWRVKRHSGAKEDTCNIECQKDYLLTERIVILSVEALVAVIFSSLHKNILVTRSHDPKVVVFGSGVCRCSCRRIGRHNQGDIFCPEHQPDSEPGQPGQSRDSSSADPLRVHVRRAMLGQFSSMHHLPAQLVHRFVCPGRQTGHTSAAAGERARRPVRHV